MIKNIRNSIRTFVNINPLDSHSVNILKFLLEYLLVGVLYLCAYACIQVIFTIAVFYIATFGGIVLLFGEYEINARHILSSETSFYIGCVYQCFNLWILYMIYDDWHKGHLEKLHEEIIPFNESSKRPLL